ncbi:hypothetical protein [Pseudomonas mandelii]|jgi:very-short-patch-repair endonuclease|uniref:DUF559 domain-containing protein n=1 Tax=Pseudomonas mandelii TaxID=75612 RepID=A0A502IHV0_9PSED|nr:hypothetical protein [Pseudomonas mandelii]TPG84750.1 hypothetical protein EAH74_12040 [Pseudomonas mandelii]
MWGPFAVEDLVSSAVQALKIRGDARAIAVLVAGQCALEPDDSDMGINYWALTISLNVQIFFAMTEQDRELVRESISTVISPFYSATPNDALSHVVISPMVGEASDGWREDAMRFVQGEGVTNQGRVRSDNIASKEHQGLLFRSQAEITLFKALCRAKIAVAPLPVFVRHGKKYHRLEPDFVVVYQGLTFVIEVDGDTYHHETPAQADQRLIPLTYEGVEVRRVQASEVKDDCSADSVVRNLCEFMARRKSAR